MAQYVPNAKALRREQRLINEPLWRLEREIVRGLLSRLRAATDDATLLLIQRDLVLRLKARQNLIAELSAERDEAGQELLAAVGAEPRDEQAVRSAQGAVSGVTWTRDVQHPLHHLLLSITDVLCWRRLGADRAALGVLGKATRVGWLSSGSGWDAELRAVDQLWEQDGVLSVINDATTCIRLGDLTCLFPDRIEVREVKAGAVRPESVQMRRLGDAIELINERRAEFEGTRWAIVRTSSAYRTHLDQLPELLEGARTLGRSVRQVSAHVVIVARSLTHPLARDAAPFDHADARALAGWSGADVVFMHGTSLRRMRDRHETFPLLAPLGLYPLDIDDVADLIIGELDVTSFLNASAVARYVAGRGFAAAAIDYPDSGGGFIDVRKQSSRGEQHGMIIAPELREMMMLELMTTPCLADHVEALFAAGRKDPDLVGRHVMVVPGSERTAWALP